MHEPGFKVMHQADIDTNSTCLTLEDLCSRGPRPWSDAHPGHVPMMVQVEMKDADGRYRPMFDALEARDPLGVRRASEIVTPTTYAVDCPTLGEAVQTNGWPTLGEIRGKVLFTLDNEGAPRRRTASVTRRSRVA